MRNAFSLLIAMAMFSLVVMAADLEAGKSAYVIHDGQALLSDKDPDSSTVTTLKSHHAYTIIQVSGQWAQLKSGSSTGWVYVANLSRDEPPEVNASSFKTDASSTSLNAAARGIDDDAKGYANRKGETESANDVIWMEHENDAISKADVQAYMKAHHLGEYSGSK